MTPAAWTTMIVICSVVWGGFVALLVFAIRSEGDKARRDDGDDRRGA